MEQRLIGRTGLQCSVIGLGTMTFNDSDDTRYGAFGQTGQAEAGRLVSLAIDHGVTLFDTSDNYANGRSEEILGQALGPKRKDIVLTTKAFGRTGRGAHDIGLSRRHLIAACEASLKRLGTDWIDLYQIHNHDALVPMEETLRALDDLVRSGKVRYIGCSNHYAWQMTKALGISARLGLHAHISQQILYSLLYRHAEHELIPAAMDQGVGSLIYSPLAQGYLTGKFTEREKEGRLVATNQLAGVDTEKARAIVSVLDTISREGDVPRTLGQLALRWLIDRPGVTSVIVGARDEAQLADNLGAARIALSVDETNRLDTASVLAAWYPQTAQRIFHRERNPREE
ncbi:MULTISPECIES: aldo/keto reductase [unclassified Novosphingobium]|uniref:aldo/keto reductase n=1 Tax=unclassified Novosphingobium TaxID=2644732 RepID=UPI000D30B07E|nr:MULTISPECIES: aldo/keto reductase [unclassified Novosphingobium]PTR12577.1 aryl-alcohol dehydrogenase-like predicted oxidoreductase [Novosphingobium sp. GV055]PUB06361.1 aryl-alcohol dehydrogenase-like predicted oxidoreductase [Novosphingobium sp. GV061]PUB22412.1 aryl-alcohol dehydrogenase-like predicted oxidoreductase [Novosphingobium sp. GV079]PUB44437.1 aryl-alcohol dehydrogenase-like predicted oxidoreductase [Novosphingobium sp. GV027]